MTPYVWAENLRHNTNYVGRCIYDTSCNVKKRAFRHVRPSKIQICPNVRAVWSESSLSAVWIAKDVKFFHVDNEDSDQTARMRRLIWFFFGCTCLIYWKVPVFLPTLVNNVWNERKRLPIRPYKKIMCV